MNIRVAGLCLCIVLAASAYGAGGGGGGGGNKGNPEKQKTALEWYNHGKAASDSGKYAEAAQDFQKAIAANDGYAEAYNMLGFCTRKMGKPNDAFPYYEKALKLKPDFPEAREYYGEAYLQVGDLTRAVQQYVVLQKAGNSNAAELLEKIDDYVNKK